MHDIVHYVRAIHGFCQLPPASGTLFGIMSKARATSNSSFPEKGHVAEKISRCYLRNVSALAVNCCVIMHCLEVSCKEDQITSTQLE